jgi:hypothetical protein
MKRLFAIAVLSLAVLAEAPAETVNIKYRETPVDLKPFVCTDTVSSFVNRVCYDKRQQYLVIQLKTTWYHWCEVDEGTVGALLIADSKGRYFNANIKGKFDCRARRVPTY